MFKSGVSRIIKIAPTEEMFLKEHNFELWATYFFSL